MYHSSNNSSRERRQDWGSGGGGSSATPGDALQQPRMLALWTSLHKSREVYEFCESGSREARSFQFDIAHTRGLGGEEILRCIRAEYAAVLIASSREDAVDHLALHWLRVWARVKRFRGESPVFFCREAGEPGEGGNGNVIPWLGAVHQLVREFQGDLFEEIAPLVRQRQGMRRASSH